MMELNFDQVFQVLLVFATVFIFWMSHKSFPPEPTAQLIRDLRGISADTPNKIDDILVEIADVLNQIRTNMNMDLEIDSGATDTSTSE